MRGLSGRVGVTPGRLRRRPGKFKAASDTLAAGPLLGRGRGFPADGVERSPTGGCAFPVQRRNLASLTAQVTTRPQPRFLGNLARLLVLPPGWREPRKAHRLRLS